MFWTRHCSRGSDSLMILIPRPRPWPGCTVTRTCTRGMQTEIKSHNFRRGTQGRSASIDHMRTLDVTAPSKNRSRHRCRLTHGD